MPPPVWPQRVIPLGTDLVPLETKTAPLVSADALAGLIAAALEHSLDLQVGRGGGTGDIADDGFERAQRYTRPVHADVAEQPMLDRIPLRAACRIVTHRHRQAAGVTQLL